MIFWGASPDLESTREQLNRLIERRLPGVTTSGWFALLRSDDGSFVGDVVLEPASWDPELAEIGWHVAKRWQRRGYATEGAAALLAEARSEGVEDVWAKILPDNRPSQSVARSLGMAKAGELDHKGLAHDLWVARRSGGSRG